MRDVESHQSGIEGLGIFALRAFRAGERIHRINIVREVTAATPLQEDLGERQDHCAYPNGKTVLYGAPDRYTNHSCDPNAFERHDPDATYLVARRDIAAGAEITCDYNINIVSGTEWPCSCGAARCAGRVVGDFFRLPIARQREYRPLLAPWFLEAHREQLRTLDERK